MSVYSVYSDLGGAIPEVNPARDYGSRGDIPPEAPVGKPDLPDWQPNPEQVVLGQRRLKDVRRALGAVAATVARVESQTQSQPTNGGTPPPSPRNSR